MNNGDGTFTDANKEVGLPSDIQFGWGTVTGDFNNDGWLDLYIAQNFSPVGVIGRERSGASPGRIFVNTGGGKFSDYTYLSGTENFDRTGDYLDGRGVIRFDFNNDGQMDLFLMNAPQFEEPFPYGETTVANTATPKLFTNLGNKKNWLEISLVGKGKSNRDAIGAVIEVFADSGYQKHMIAGGGSAFSSSSRTVHFGLDKARTASLVVHWPDGSKQRLENLQAGHIWELTQGRSVKLLHIHHEDGEEAHD